MSTDTTKNQEQQAEREGLMSPEEPMRRGGMDWFVLLSDVRGRPGVFC